MAENEGNLPPTAPQVGQVVNGHVWTGTEWVLLIPDPAPPGINASGLLMSPKKRGGLSLSWKIAFAVLAVVLAVGVFTQFRSGTKVGGTSSSSVASPRTVTFEVTGTALYVNITLRAGKTKTQQSDVVVPMKSKLGNPLTYSAYPGDFLYISAQNQGEYGSVTCTIKVDGVTLISNTSSGAYVIATCDGSA